MRVFRYSEWDGSQGVFDLDADRLMDELGQNLMSRGDLADALRRMQQGGLRDAQGRRLPSIQEMMQRLRQRRQEQLEKYNLGSMLDEIKEKLEQIIRTEREGIRKKLDEAARKADDPSSELPREVRDRLRNTVEEMAGQNLARLDALPDSMNEQIKELSNYDFMDEDARNQFKELMDMLKKQAMESYGRDLLQRVKNMDPETLAAMRHMAEAINQMLEQKMRGEEPDFEGFMQQFGDFFGDDPPKDLDEMIERLQSQIAQAQSLMESLSAEDRQELEQLLSSMLDDTTQYELAKMVANMDALHPSEKSSRRYPFSGEESLSYSEAMKLMETLQRMDTLEEQFKDSRASRSLESIDEELTRELLGDDAAEQLKAMNEISKLLEEAGYIRWQDGKYELTPRGMRKIGQKALQDIFAQLRKDRTGGHRLDKRGSGGERIVETKPFEFGDDFHVDIQRTIMNSLYREPGVPVDIRIDDFEVFRTEELTRSATVLLLDMSLSMPMRGNFEAAKRVTLAFDGLIRSQYPRDSLKIVGFSSYARELKKEQLFYMGWDEFDPYTNMQHGLYVARKLLDKDRSSNKQIILISDGEPTAHFEGEQIFFQYPPTLRTIQMTLREVRKCTQKGITINTFMLDSGGFVGAFVTQMARLNKGRVFFTSADSLGEYLLVDYISNKKKVL